MLIYILTRLFVTKKNYYLEGDEIRHLVTSRNFYKLWNKSFYDMHPPFYSWLVRMAGAKPRSGVVVSFLCSIGLYIVSSRLYEALGLNLDQKALALFCLAFNYTLIYYSNRMFRYQLIALLGTGMIYSLLIHKFLIAGLLWGLLSLTCTFAGLRAFWIWLLLGANWLTLAVGFMISASWLVDKALVYKNNVYYPSGVEGMIEKVNSFTWKQLFSPLYFSWSYAYYGKKELGYDLKNWLKRTGGVFGLYPPLTVLVPIALFFAIKGALQSPIWVSILVLVLLYPSVYKRFLPRNSIIVIPLICFLLAKGFWLVPISVLVWVSVCFFIVFFHFQRANLLTIPKIKGRVTSYYLNDLPKDGVLVEGMICQPIACRIHKRVVVIPYDPESYRAIYQTDLSIIHFRLNYAVYSENGGKKGPPGYPALEYIKKFKLLTTIEEDGDKYYVYEIPEFLKFQLS